jgi:double-stranded uracil-DNA glycosylase
MKAADRRRPTRAELQAACGKSVPDVIAPNLKVLFVGINPGLYTAAIGHHFGRPGNRFWPALYGGGLTDRLLLPYEERELLDRGYGITNLVNRATATANELKSADLIEGGRILQAKVRKYRPKCLAFLGIGAYRAAFSSPAAKPGPQPERLADALVWILPNPSGLNAHYQQPDFDRLFRELREAVEASPG